MSKCLLHLKCRRDECGIRPANYRDFGMVGPLIVSSAAGTIFAMIAVWIGGII